MSKSCQRFVSVLLCLALLAPAIERSIHSWDHRNDFHCVSSSKHLHGAEHSCSLCDYELPAQEAGLLSSALRFYSRVSLQITCYTACFSSGSVIFSTSRAPPTA
jgi:hypothetical protein